MAPSPFTTPTEWTGRGKALQTRCSNPCGGCNDMASRSTCWYLCAGFKEFLHHVEPGMKRMLEFIRSGIPAQKIMETTSSIRNSTQLWQRLNAGQLEGRRLLSAEAVAEMGRDQTESLSFNPVTDHPVHFGLGWPEPLRKGPRLSTVRIRPLLAPFPGLAVCFTSIRASGTCVEAPV